MVAVRSAHFSDLARMAPRTADAAFEAMRHANGCATQLEGAEHAVRFLRDLIGNRVNVHAPRILFGGFFSDELHEQVIERKSRAYAEIIATVENVEHALASAKASLERLGHASVRVMRDLRVLQHTGDASCCRAVTAELVALYTRYTEHAKALRDELTNMLPNELAAHIATRAATV